MHEQGSKIVGLDQAQKLAQKLLPERYRRIEQLERYVDGTQYAGRQDWFAPTEDVPLLERAPNIVYSIVLAAIRQHIDFCFGEGRFPKLTTGQSEDDTDIDDESGLSPEDSKRFDAWLAKFIEHCKFDKACESGLKAAEGTSSACFILCARKGRLYIETTKSKWANPTFDPTGTEVEKLEIQYPYIDVVVDERTGVKRARVMVYRRVVDATSDRVYLPAEVRSEFDRIQWQVDDAKSADHGLGFCPVVWYAFRKECDAANVFDGHAIHETQLDELDALNIGLSQRGRAAIYSGDPQLWETGVSPDETPAPMGRQPEMEVRHGQTAEGIPYSLLGFSERPMPARRKGAGVVWRYDSEKAQVGMLTLPPGALDGISGHCEDLEDKISAVLGYTAVSAEQVKGATSGKALGYIYARTTAFVSGVRKDCWDGMMLPLMQKLLRMALLLDRKKPGSLYIPGIAKIRDLLASFEQPVEGSGDEWFGPNIRPQWGPYFEATAEEEKATVETVATASQAELVPKKLALEKLRHVFPFETAAMVLDELEKEKQERKDDEVEEAQRTLDAELTLQKASASVQ